MGFIDNLRQRMANMLGASPTDFNRFNDAFMWATVGGGYSRYDPEMHTYLEEGYNENSLVFSVINAMAQKSSTVPIYIRDIKNEEEYRKLNQLRDATSYNLQVAQKMRYLALEKKALADRTMPLPLVNPNPYQTWTELHQMYKTFLRLTGNAYFYMEIPEEGMNKGVPQAIYLLPSHKVKIVVKDGVSMIGLENPVKEYQLVESNHLNTFPAENVIHIKYANPNYTQDGQHLYGFSPLRPLLKKYSVV